MEKTIALFILTHKKTYIPSHPLFVPLQIGVALNEPIDEYVQDNVGKNISHKNKSYCELTGQYWAWQNVEAEYYGFYHYRRYFSFAKEKYPYRILDFPDDATLSKLGYDAEKMEQHIRQYDIIVPMAENMHETAWQNYSRAPQHYVEDLQLVVDILKEQHPEYTDAAEQYLNGTKLYLKNMYIMKKEYFHAYCTWLFPILAEFDRRNDWDKYNNNAAAMRVDGYLAERLFGVWYTYMKQNKNLCTCELARIHFSNMDGKGKLQYMKWVNYILPPGTKRRNLVATCAKSVLKAKG